MEERLNPRDSFKGHVLATPWDHLQLAYFAGYAMWTYLNTPFLFALPGVEREEIEPWPENGEVWRRLGVTFPPSIATHSAEQTFYFDQQGLLKRHDYDVDIAPGATGAHYVSELEQFSGITVPTQRRVFGRDPGWEGRAESVGGFDRPQRGRVKLRRESRCEDEMKEAEIASKGTMDRLETAPTEFIQSAGVTFAYRRLGPPSGTPLILLQHFSGNMDGWDPAVVDALARDGPVVVFDNTGVGKSDGSTPDNVAQMAEDARSLISALGLTQVDLLGYSLGGCVAPRLAAAYPDLVRRVVLVATAAQGGEEHLLAVLEEAALRTRKPPISGCLSSSRLPRRARQLAEHSCSASVPGQSTVIWRVATP